MSNRMPLRLWLYTLGIFVGAVLALVFTWRADPLRASWLLLALVVGAMVAELMAVEVSGLSVSIAYSICAASAMLLGPSAAGLVTGLSSVPASFLVRENRLLRGLLNWGQLTLAGVCGGWVYLAFGGRPLLGAWLDSADFPRVILPVLLFALTHFLVNTVLVGIAASIKLEVPFFRLWRSTFLWSTPTQAALTMVALALAEVVASEGVIGLALFIVPLMIARQFYERYLTLKRTYADTVRSLVAVIEAKDAYTRGHSERVASYAVAIAQLLGFSDQRLERLELAALLHDLGKVGISRDILLKSAGLTSEEYEVIKTHPDIGAHIIEEVPFLADLVPFISSHHERIDGTGYGANLSGDAIPIEARVLGVADAFDAMTSSRPYRKAMSVDETIRELRRGAGAQFDQVIVETFIEAIDSRTLDSILPEVAVDEAV